MTVFVEITLLIYFKGKKKNLQVIDLMTEFSVKIVNFIGKHCYY